MTSAGGRVVPVRAETVCVHGDTPGAVALLRAIRAAADAPKNPRAWDAAALELEASRAVAEKLGRNPQGFFVPLEVQRRSPRRKVRSSSTVSDCREESYGTRRSVKVSMARCRRIARVMSAL